MAVSPPPPLDRENSCAFLRLFFAFLVVCGHACVVGGFGEEPLARFTNGLISGREIAVQGFFVLSGFLIAKSLGENPSLWRFVCHRAFRILPALWFYLIIMTFVVAPWLLETQFPGQYRYGELLQLGPRSAWHYLTGNWSLQAQEFLIVPLFAENPERFQANGSLWSVRFEAAFYICAAAGGAVLPMEKRWAWPFTALCGLVAIWSGSTALIFVGVALLWRKVTPQGWGVLVLFVLLFVVEWLSAAEIIVLRDWPRWSWPGFWFAVQPSWRISALAFLGGMLCWRYRADLRYKGWMALLAAAILLAGVCSQQWRLVMPIALPYLVLYLAARLPFQKLDRWGDYSYGIYIFSFPIQQLLYFHGLPKLGFAAYLAGSLILSLAAAVLSWWLVEKPALRMGRKLGAWNGWMTHRVHGGPACLPVAVQLSLPMDGTNCHPLNFPSRVQRPARSAIPTPQSAEPAIR